MTSCGNQKSPPAPALGRISEYGKPTSQESGQVDELDDWEGSAPDVPMKWDTGMGSENRANFIRKVYGILAMQMGITVAICAFAMFVRPVQAVFIRVATSPVASMALFIPSLCVLCALQVHKSKHPTNYYLLMAFTVLMSISVAGICAAYQKAGLGALVFQAFGLTGVIFGTLSAYALKSGKDFTWMGGMLSVALTALMAFSLFGWLFGFHGGMLFSLFGALLFSGFILYDTSRLMTEYGPDDYIMACVELYLDIVNLFLYLLQFLSEMQNRD